MHRITIKYRPALLPVYETTTSVRRIYFAQPSFTVDSGPEVYYPDPDIEVGPVAPGVYAVVGSAGVHETDTSDYITYFGRRNTAEALDELDQTRRISSGPGKRRTGNRFLGSGQ